MITSLPVSLEKPASKKVTLLGAVLLIVITAFPGAQESTTLEELPGLRERAVILRIVSRIVEQNQEEIWNSDNSRLTIPGRPVGIKLVGSDLVVAAQFTPFLRPGGRHILVTQSQIWINVPNEGMSYRTTMQTIPLEFSEQVYFFPLGSVDEEDEPQIEIQLTLEPYIRNGEDNHAHMERTDPSDPSRNRRRSNSQ